ncbi:ABC transporter ATP-binding protein [Micromonospora sp. NBS 11-29]|uniref:ABC transporter ATP-binding protein n=1 Tax=Micromonospora sp. NBS 11-29 TaxID=1960879 RepID=UPI000B78AC86|nr:ABC transporter ATP-binding protein [Micromonospora sp. NBS 11-29]
METLTVTGVTKTFGGPRPAVDELSFTLGGGEFGVVVGPSGAGKTTLLNMIAGLVPPDTGEITLDGASLAGTAPERRDIAMVFENYALYPHLSVRRNLEFPLRAPVRRGTLSRSQITDRVTQVAETLRIPHLLDRLPSQLSGGQRQRVSLGRALVRRPRLLLLDEPITHLDAKLRHEMRTELKRIQRELGVTTLYATPDQSDALALADLVVVLDAGRAWQVGTAADVYERPANVTVARTLGDPRINLLPGRRDAAGVTVLGQRVDADHGPAGPVTVGVRPGDVELSTEPLAGAAAGRVLLAQTLGYQDVVYVDVEGATVRATVPAGIVARPGDPAWVRLPAARLHVFEAASGQALRHREVV